jgi:hypothetical protein
LVYDLAKLIYYINKMDETNDNTVPSEPVSVEPEVTVEPNLEVGPGSASEIPQPDPVEAPVVEDQAAANSGNRTKILVIVGLVALIAISLLVMLFLTQIA